MGSLERFRLTSGASGCFLLYSRGELVYVGSSGNVFARVGVLWQAQARMRRGKPERNPWEPAMEFDEVGIALMSERLAEREAAILAAKHQPKYNEIPEERETAVPGFEKSDLFKGLQRLRKDYVEA